MIYHLFNANTYHHTPNLINSILEYSSQTNKLGIKEHFFLLNFPKNKTTKKERNISLYNSIFDKYDTLNYKFLKSDWILIKKLISFSKSDHLIIHDNQTLFGYKQFFWFLLWLCGLKINKNASFIFWGVPEKKKISKNFLFSILYRIHNKVLKSFKNVISLTIDDAKKLENWYDLSNVRVISYLRDFYNEFISFKNYSKDYDQPYRIMISHSAFKQNGHLEIFNKLARFKNKNIEIICPLSYGDDHYRKLIIKSGKNLFGNKFIFLNKLMPEHEYIKLLSTIDIYISNSTTQTGLFVINFCICTGKKIYIKGNNYNWMKHLNYKINNISELADISFSELVRPISIDWIHHNDKIARQSLKKNINDWKIIFNQA